MQIHLGDVLSPVVVAMLLAEPAKFEAEHLTKGDKLIPHS